MNQPARASSIRRTPSSRSAGSSGCTSPASSSWTIGPSTTSPRYGVTPPRVAAVAGLPGRLRRAGAETSSASWSAGRARAARASSRTARASPEHGDLLDWMTGARRRPAASYVNWVGRTVRQVREEARPARRRSRPISAPTPDARQPRRRLSCATTCCAFVAPGAAGRAADPDAAERRRPLGWRLAAARPPDRRAARPAPGLRRCCSCPRRCSLVLLRCAGSVRPGDRAAAGPPSTSSGSPTLEDHDVTNQFSAMGDAQARLVPPLTLDLRAAGSCSTTPRATSTRTAILARVQTIHFARWVLLDDKQRLLFASNYDGSLESYMDDFINKVALGINVVFSNGVGFPRTRLAAPGRRQGRAEVQVLPPPARAADGGLVQRLSRPHRRRDGAQQPHPRAAWSSRR